MEKIVVDSTRKSSGLGLKELWKYRELFMVLAYRDIRIRYAQTFLGLLWAIIQPIATILIFTIVFGKVAKVDTGNVPYPLFAISGMTSWSFFAYVLNQSGNSIITAQEMVKKIYFPRLVIPLSKAVAGLIDFTISFLFVFVLMIYFRFTPSANLIYLPVFILLTVISGLAFGIWLSALTIRYRDFQHVIPFMVQFGLYATPIGYQAAGIIDNLPKWAVYVFYLNPMAGVVEGFRWSLLGGSPPHAYSFISFSIVIGLFLSGLWYFKRIEKIMADIV